MDATWVQTLVVIAAVGCGLMGGVYFAFSTFVMSGIRRLPASQGLAAMQAINRAAPSPLFMLALFGTGFVSVAVVVVALTNLDHDGAWIAVLAGMLYVETIVQTAAYHVPANNAIDALDAADPASADAWTRYASRWTALNHVRTVASLAAAALFTVSYGLA
jgi:uncharacterized membrane protein